MKLVLLSLLASIFYVAFTPPQDDLAKSIERGKQIYAENCVTCHLGAGEGVPGTYPPLAQSDFLLKTPKKAIHAIKFGLQGTITVNGIVYNSMMPNPGLANDEIADVVNYIQNSWGNTSRKKTITTKMVEEVKEK